MNDYRPVVALIIGPKGAGKTWFVAALYHMLKRGLTTEVGTIRVKEKRNGWLEELHKDYINKTLDSTRKFEQASFNVVFINNKGKEFALPEIKLVDSPGEDLVQGDGNGLQAFLSRRHTHLISVYSCADIIKNIRGDSAEQPFVDRYMKSSNALKQLQQRDVIANPSNKLIFVFSQFDMLYNSNEEDSQRRVRNVVGNYPYTKAGCCVFSSSHPDLIENGWFDLTPFYILMRDQIEQMDNGLLDRLKYMKLVNYLDRKIDESRGVWDRWATE